MANNKRTRSSNYPKRSNSSTRVYENKKRGGGTPSKKRVDNPSSKNSTSKPINVRSSYNNSVGTSQFRKTNKNKPVKRRNQKTDTTMYYVIGLLALLAVLCLYLIGPYFTIFLVVGIILILIISRWIKKKRKNKVAKIIINILMGVIALIAILVTAVIIYFGYIIVTTAPKFDPKQLNEKQTTIVLDSDDKVMAELGTEKREIITYNQLSENLINAIIATEDSRFFQHNGFDAARFLRASIGQLAGKSDAGGGSTLSMQVIKNTFTSTESRGLEGIKRKFTDIYLSVFKLEKMYTKQEIIEFYVNNHFLGSNAYGVEQASQTYFGKNAADLNLSEAAMIAGMFKAPDSYNPYKHPEATEKRRTSVLKLMYRHGYISKEEMDIANSIPVEDLIQENKSEDQEFSAYLDTVIAEAYAKGYNPYSGLYIYTNMNRKKQKGLDDIFSGKTFDWENKVVQSGIAAVDVDTGKIIAIGAGRNRSGALTFNFATDIDKQIGSTAKPIFDYAPGIEFNNWSTYEIFDDSKYYYSSGQEIRDSDRGYMGNITLRTALAQSRNIPALKAFQQIDKDKLNEFVRSLGIEPETPLHEAHAIGSFNGKGNNPLSMAAAYATFANGGTYYKPYTIRKIVDRSTDEITQFQPQGKRVMSDSTAFMITDVLKTAVTSGLSSGAKLDGINIAAKTGTTNFDEKQARSIGLPSNAVNDAWVVGFDPDTAIGMWYGYEKINKESARKGYYSKSGLVAVQRGRLYRAAGSVIFNKTGKDFEAPDSVVKLPIERGSNPAKLASSGTPQDMVVYEYFKKGTEPTETSNKYNRLANVTGLKATYDPNAKTVTLKWNAASEIGEAEENYGKFGYKIYMDGKFLGFTEDTTYIISNLSTGKGTYKVVTTYEAYGGNSSSGITVTLKDTSTYSVSLRHTSSIYSVGDSLDYYDLSPSSDDVIATKDGTPIDVTVTTYTLDENDREVTLNTTTRGIFRLYYKVYYDGRQIGLKYRTITIT